MVTGSANDYSHSEHVEMLRVEPPGFVSLAVLSRASFGESNEETASALDMRIAGVNSAMKRARDLLVAPSDAAATYSAFAVELLDDMDRLTPTDIRVLKLLASGESAERIAEIVYNATYRTRRNWVYEAIKKMRDKLGARTNAAAIRLGIRYNLLHPEVGDPPLPEWPE